MELEKLFGIWEKSTENISGKHKLSKAMITKIISAKNKKTISFLNFNLLFYWGIQVVNLILISMNLMGYRQNSTMIWVLIGQLCITLPVMVYGIYIFIKNREINNFSENLVSLLQKQLKFFRSYYEIWLVLIAFTTLILIFNVNIMVDNIDGHFRINKVNFFIIVNIAVFLFIYLTQKLASNWRFKALKANLSDLQAGILDQSEKFEKAQKKFMWIWILIAILLLIAFLFGVLKALAIDPFWNALNIRFYFRD